MQSFKDGKEKSAIVAGPWGGQGGDPWDDGVYTTVRQVVINHGSSIDYVMFEYDLNGRSFWSEKHGADGNTKIDRVKLNYPHEFITSVSGHYGGSPAIIKSLIFQSNNAKYGPFGTETGTPFSAPVSGGKIVGFHGRSGSYLTSIGFYLKQLWTTNPSNALVPSQGFVSSFDKHEDSKVWNRGSSTISTPIRHGPWGGSGGNIFDDGIYTGVREVNLTRAVGISTIKVLYDRNGQAVWGNKHGVSRGFRADKITFDFPMEILTHITGYFSTAMIMGPTLVRSLTFHTTKKIHGPYGEEQGTFFSSCLTDGRVVGFHGREGWHIDAIGVHVLEGKVLPMPTSVNDSDTAKHKALAKLGASRLNMHANSEEEIAEEVTHGVVKEPVPVGPGPWGGNGGSPWDDGVYSGIRQIHITRGKFISSIQIEYDRSGQSVWSARHGGSAETPHRIKLDYPHEILNCICGYYNINKEDGPIVLRSLSFFSSRGKYGPFGEEMGTFFTSATTAGKVVGFHGRSGLYLDAIGVHMQHWLGENKPTSKHMFSKYLF